MGRPWRVLAVLAMLGSVGRVDAASVTLLWDKSLSPEVVRYGVYWRQWQQPGTGVWPQMSKTVPETQTVISDLLVGVPYLYEVTALNAEGLESIPASIIHTITNDTLPVVVAKPTGVTVVKIYPLGAFMIAIDFRWIGVGEALYNIRSKSPVGGNWNLNTITNGLNRTTVTNLVQMRDYDFKLTAVDPSGNESVPVLITLRTNELTTLTAGLYKVVVDRPVPPPPPPLPSRAPALPPVPQSTTLPK